MTDSQNALDDRGVEDRNIWLRGLLMLVFVIFFGIAEAILFAFAVVQFFWMLITGKPNGRMADFGTGLGKWLERVALFQTGASEHLPFPWSDWEEEHR